MFYDRMLLDVDPENSVFVHRALQWLAFAGRPLKLYELAEAVAIDPDQPFSVDDRLMDCNLLLEMIPAGLVSSTAGTFPRYPDESVSISSPELDSDSSCSTGSHDSDCHAPNSINDEDSSEDDSINDEDNSDEDSSEDDSINDEYNSDDDSSEDDSINDGYNSDDDSSGEDLGFVTYDTCTIHLAHFSVKEYLVSGRIIKGPANMYSLDENLVDKAMVKCCFRYLTHIGNSRLQIDERLVYQFSLLYYSSECLVHHLEKLEAQVRDPEVDDLMLEFFDTGKTDAWRIWTSVALLVSSNLATEEVYIKRWHRDSGEKNPWNIVPENLPHPITWLSSLGLTEALKQTLPALPPLTLNSIPQMDEGFLGRFGLSLFEAARKGCPKTVSVLLDAGADINAGLGTERFALMVAIYHGSEFVKFFLDRGATVNAENCRLTWHDSPLRRACSRGYVEVVKLLLDSGADPNFVAKDKYLGYSNVPLAVAVGNGSPDLVKILLAYGANPNYVSDDNTFPTALHVAIFFGKSVELFRLLFEAGASLDVGPRGTDTPFHLVARSHSRSPRENIKIMKLLLEYGADPSKRGVSMRTPLISAVATYCSSKVLKFLLGLNIDIHAVSTCGNALTTAIELCRPADSLRDECLRMVIILLEAGAYQCADLHWQRAYNLARQLRDGPDDSADVTSSENHPIYYSDTDEQYHMREKEMIFDLMKQYDAKRNTEAVEKMEEIVLDVARLFMED
jgi:ankyrin repeat protein